VSGLRILRGKLPGTNGNPWQPKFQKSRIELKRLLPISDRHEDENLVEYADGLAKGSGMETCMTPNRHYA
jgi:hypothetical protein